MLDGGTNYGKGEQLWQPYMVRGTIGGAVFGPVGPLATWQDTRRYDLIKRRIKRLETRPE